MSAQRAKWMDLARGTCILLVLSLHASAALSAKGLPTPEPIQTFNLLFAPFRMALLMFLSGMLLERSLAKPAGEYVGGKLAQIFWPFLIWSLVILAAEGRLTLEFVLKTPISAPTLLWYLWFLFAYYLLALGMRRLSVPVLPIAALSLAASVFLPEHLRMSRFAYLFFFFLLGHAASRRPRALTGHAPLAFLGLALAVAGAVLSAQGWDLHYRAVTAWAPVGLILFLLWASRFPARTRLGGGIEWIGRNSIVFYVGHYPVALAVAGAIAPAGDADAPDAPDAVVAFLAIMAASLAAGTALQALRQRSDLVAGLFDARRLPPRRRAPA